MLRKLHEKGWKALLMWVRNMFLAGLAMALPVIVTIWILGVVAKFVDRAGDGILKFAAYWANVLLRRSADNLITPEDFHVPLFFDLNLIGLVVPILVIVALGAMATNVIGRRIVAAMERALETIPVVNFIYRSLRQVIDSFKSFGRSRNFKRVAFVEYPAPGCRLLGFVTGQFHDPDRGSGVTSVFIPTSPNPMTGFVVVVDDDRVIDSSMSLEEATKLILSAGLLAPNLAAPNAVAAVPGMPVAPVAAGGAPDPGDSNPPVSASGSDIGLPVASVDDFGEDRRVDATGGSEADPDAGPSPSEGPGEPVELRR